MARPQRPVGQPVLFKVSRVPPNSGPRVASLPWILRAWWKRRWDLRNARWEEGEIPLLSTARDQRGAPCLSSRHLLLDGLLSCSHGVAEHLELEAGLCVIFSADKW